MGESMLQCPFLGVTLVVFPASLQDFDAKRNFLEYIFKKGLTYIMLIKSVIQKCKNKHQHDKHSLNKVLLKFDNKFCNAYKTHT